MKLFQEINTYNGLRAGSSKNGNEKKAKRKYLDEKEKTKTKDMKDMRRKLGIWKLRDTIERD